MAASINVLSNELLLQIIESVDDRMTLLNLMLCSRRLSDLTKPQLYSSVAFTYPHQGYEVLHAFARAVLSSSELASYVRSFAIDAWSTQDDGKCRPETSFNLYEDLKFDFLETEVKRQSQSDKERETWIVDLKNGVEDALLVLILPTLSKLDHLQVETPYGPGYYETMLQRIRTRLNPDFLPYFQALTTVTTWWSDTENGLDFKWVRPFFTIPSLRKFSGTMIRDPERPLDEDMQWLMGADDPMNEVLLPGSSGVLDIELNRSNIGPDSLCEIIRACKNLRTFKYIHADVNVGGRLFFPSALGPALQEVKQSLESLWLDYDQDISGNGTEEEYDPLGSLRDFTALKHFRGIRSDLTGSPWGSCLSLVENLPAAIEDLHFSPKNETAMFELFEQLEEAVTEKSTRFPMLSHVIIEGPFTTDTYPPGYDHFGRLGSQYYPPPEIRHGASRRIIPYELDRLLLLSKAENVLIEVEDTNLVGYWKKRLELGAYVDSVVAKGAASVGA